MQIKQNSVFLKNESHTVYQKICFARHQNKLDTTAHTQHDPLQVRNKLIILLLAKETQK